MRNRENVVGLLRAELSELREKLRDAEREVSRATERRDVLRDEAKEVLEALERLDKNFEAGNVVNEGITAADRTGAHRSGQSVSGEPYTPAALYITSILRCALDSQPHAMKRGRIEEAARRDLVEKKLFLPADDKVMKSGDKRYQDAVGIAVKMAKNSGWLHSPARGYYQITEDGIEELRLRQQNSQL